MCLFNEKVFFILSKVFSLFSFDRDTLLISNRQQLTLLEKISGIVLKDT